jgi:hypothetical protein
MIKKGRIRVPDTGSRLFTYGNKKVAGGTTGSEKTVWEEREEQQDSAHQPPAPTTLLATAKYKQCCGSGSGIRCLFDPWIRDG